MASLRNIMNVDDDHHDSSSVKKDKEPPHQSPPHQSDSSTSLPNFATHPDLTTNVLSPSSLHRGATPSQALPSLTHDHYPSSTSPGFPNSTSATRRRSNTSTDSMDSPYLQAYGPMVSSAHIPMRPVLPGPSGPDAPLKLTPVTRKVSRAKKGERVHVCEQCRPSKVFSRAEHLRRHQLSHGPPDFPCPVPGCDKAFHRRDLLERHQQRHSSESDTHEPQQKTASSTPSPYPPAVPPETFFRGPTQNWPQPALPGSPNEGHGLSSSQYITSTPEQPYPAYPPIYPPGFPGPQDDYSPQRVTTDMSSGNPSLTIHREALEYEWERPYVSSESSPYSTSSDDPTPGWHPHPSPYPPGLDEAGSPPGDLGYQTSISYSVSPEARYDTDSMPIGIHIFGEGAMYNPQPHRISLVRSISPQLEEVQTSEPLVYTLAPLPTERLVVPSVCGPQRRQRNGLLVAKNGLPAKPAPILHETVSAYIKTYWAQVDTAYPIIHKPTFGATTENIPEHIMVLQCAMASIATQHYEHKDDRTRGDQLHRYAWHRSKLFTENGEWPLPIMQTVLLCEYYARFRGRKKTSHQPSARFRLLYRKVLHAQQIGVAQASVGDSTERWATWIKQETLNRLLAACFLLDVHSKHYFQQSDSSSLELGYGSPETLSIPLSASTEQLWNAETPEQWQYMRGSHTGTTTIGSAFMQGITPLTISNASVFDAAILLAAHGLQLPERKESYILSSIINASTSRTMELSLDTLFGDSATANTYMALQHTPLHALLSVSGDSWLFNQKILDRNLFSSYQKELRAWCASDDCHKAAVYAVRGLRQFIDLPSNAGSSDQSKPVAGKDAKLSRRDISDYWGFYVCALICWAYSCRHTAPVVNGMNAQNAALLWIQTTTNLTAEEQGRLFNAEVAQGVVVLARDLLASENLGGCNIMLADAVGVLTKLQDGGGPGF